jgi:protein-tyrosine phosphatase
MIDIHCHPLPGLDDGAKTLEDAVEMCRMAAADGITHLVATPHCNYEYPFRPELNREKLRELEAAAGERPKLLLGCDFHLSYDNIRQVIADRANFTINGTRYVLAEFSEQFVPEHMDNVFYDLQVAGLIPILTHPERNAVFRRKPEILYHWATRGCPVQVTAQSYTGGFGSEARELSEMWLERNLVHFFASDAHDTKYRPPLLSACYRKLASARGQEEADRLMKQNPEAVIAGRPLPPAPEPVPPLTRKRPWFLFWRRQAPELGKWGEPVAPRSRRP